MVDHSDSSIEAANSSEEKHVLSAALDSDSTVMANPSAQEAIDDKRLLRKIDARVMPMLFVIYVAAFLDRTNISSALTMGLPAELDMTGQQPNVALMIFFVPYILLEIPSNILMKRFSPHIWLSGSILCFGIVMLCQGFVQSYGGLLATRFFLGIAEAGIFPGSFYLISFWYKTEEAQKRFTVYWSSTVVSGAFGSLLATGIANMNGIRGLSNWRWVFIIEGIFTVLVGIVAFFYVTDFPREATWLSAEEKGIVLAKTQSNEKHTVTVTFKHVVEYFGKARNWLGAIMYFSILVPSYSLAFFTPTIVQALGYDVVQTQLHTVPPYAAAFAFAIIVAYFSDRYRSRVPFIMFGLAVLLIGFAMLISIHGASNFSAEYAGICLAAMGALGVGGIIICWYIMNLHGHVERSIGSAFMISFGNIGGIVATFAFQKTDAPFYHNGYSICLGMTALCVLSSATYGVLIWKERKAMAGGKENKDFLCI